jgi:hypothetical protein
MSLIDMLNERGDEYPSQSDLDAYDCCSIYHDSEEVEKFNKLYKIKSPYKLVLAGPGDRPCHWKPNLLCVFREALVAGLRFPFHDFIPQLLADVQINPCQLPPNAWRIILCFMVLCLQKDLPLSVSVFRRIFQFYNSPATQAGWVYIKLRPKVPPLFNGKSFPENNTGWKSEFLYLEWEGGDWGTLFRRSFSRVSDGSAKGIALTPEEQATFDTLTQADGDSITCRSLLNEESLRAVGLSQVSERGNSLTCLCSLLICLTYSNLCLFRFAVAQMIVAAAPPPTDETSRMLRAKRNADPRGKELEPSFLRPHKKQKDNLKYTDIAGLDGASQVNVQSSVFRPSWGFRKQDSVVGSTKHSMDWSLNAITPPDYRDFVLNGDVGESESLGAQSLAAVSSKLLICLLSVILAYFCFDIC